ncbi:MAG: hypothetical protein KIT25_25675 [Enhydrobacter sp.]|nr:MAG: hypothetical protein KIT25_25675 [Enhydrobacter sp.]
MRKLFRLASTSFALALAASPALAQNASPYMAYKPASNMHWSAFTNQAQCEKGTHGSRQCVSHIFCGTTFWFPRVSFDGKQAFSTSGVVGIEERGSRRTICKVQ